MELVNRKARARLRRGREIALWLGFRGKNFRVGSRFFGARGMETHGDGEGDLQGFKGVRVAHAAAWYAEQRVGCIFERSCNLWVIKEARVAGVHKGGDCSELESVLAGHGEHDKLCEGNNKGWCGGLRWLRCWASQSVFGKGALDVAQLLGGCGLWLRARAL